MNLTIFNWNSALRGCAPALVGLFALSLFGAGCGQTVAPSVVVEQEECTDACALGAASCLDTSRARVCVKGPEGCAFEVELDCAEGSICEGGLCGGQAGCGQECGLGEAACTDGLTRRVCVEGPEGCNFEVELSCEGGTSCAEGVCSAPAACDGQALGEACEVGRGECLARGVTACIDGAVRCGADEGLPRDEACNGLDDDCDGEVDEDTGVGMSCEVGQGRCRAEGATVCEAGQRVCVAPASSPILEVCNGLDDDCDGQTDEGCAACGVLKAQHIADGPAGETVASAPYGQGHAVLSNVVRDGGRRLEVKLFEDSQPAGGFTGAALNVGIDIAAGPSGDLFVLGLRPQDGDVETFVQRVGGDGQPSWSVALPQSTGQGGEVLASSASAVVVAGARGDGGWVESFGVDGQRRWGVEVDGRIGGLDIDAGGDVFYVGASAEGMVAGRLGGDTGQPLWSQVQGEAGEALSSVASRDAQSIAVVGRKASGAWAALLSASSGALIFESVVEPGETEALDVGVDADGRLLVVGRALERGQAFLRAFQPSEEAALNLDVGWSSSTPIGLSVDGTGQIIVIGSHTSERETRLWLRTFSALCSAPEPSERVLVYLLGGQSNMDGHGRVANLSPELAEPQQDVMFFWGAEMALSQLRPASRAGARFGPEVSLGAELRRAHPNTHILLVKYAIGGSNLHTQWNPGPFQGASTGPFYANFMATFEGAAAAMQGLGLEPEVAGMVWMQGESDGVNLGVAQAYEENLTHFIERVRQDVEAPGMPFVIGKIFAPTIVERATVRLAQELVAAEHHNTSIVGTDDLPLVDSIHYNAEGQLTLGARFAGELMHHRPEPFPPPPEPPEPGEPVHPRDVVEEEADFTEVFTLEIPTSADWNIAEDVPYLLDLSDGFNLPFDRVAYFLELRPALGQTQWVWISMDPFTEQVSSLGVPVDGIFDQAAAGLSVRSNVDGVEDVDDGEAKLEFWSHCYATDPNDLYDDDDTFNDVPDCYGSMQIHSGGRTLMAFNRWTQTGGPIDLGIGSGAFGHPDWTFASNAGNFAARVLRVYVRTR